MKARSRELLDRALAAMVAAIEIYNKPNFAYRAESFTILAANAWELLLKAKWLAGNRNRVSSLYVHQGGGAKRKRIKKTRAGNPMTHSLEYLVGRLRETKALPESASKNLLLLAELRDSAVHFYHANPKLAERVHEVATAAVKNFHAASTDWFGENFGRFNIYLMPLAFVSPPDSEALVLNAEEKRLLKYVNELDSDDDPGSRYSVTVNIELRFTKSKEKSAPAVRITNDPSAPAVRLTDEQIRERYPWDYAEVTARCRERYADFKLDGKYHRVRKALERNSRYAHVRLLDPANPRSAKKPFFSPAIMQEFDKHYAVRPASAAE